MEYAMALVLAKIVNTRKRKNSRGLRTLEARRQVDGNTYIALGLPDYDEGNLTQGILRTGAPTNFLAYLWLDLQKSAPITLFQ